MKIRDLIKVKSSNIILLWSIIFILLGVFLLFLAFNGITIVIPFFNKLLFVSSFICLLIGGVLFFLKKDVKVKVGEGSETP